jgi:uncharacterized protein (TIGR02466 family)
LPTLSLFPTRIRRTALSDQPGADAFLAELEAACRGLAEEDAAGRAWSKRHGYRGYTSYASLDDLPRRATVFGELKRRLDREAGAFAGELGLALGGKRVKLDSLWVNVMSPGGTHSGHIHPLSVLSGTLYVGTPPGAGAIRFEDPRLPMMMARPPVLPDASDEQHSFFVVAPAAGDLLLWESWLRHEVTPHRGRGERISLSFNYSWG